MRFLLSLVVSAACFGQRVDPVEFFETKVRPVLAKNCFSCHTQAKLGGLEMTSRETLLKGGKSGPAISTDRPDESLLLQVIKRTHERIKMPPPPNAPLADEEIKDIARWIGRGVVWP